ncbi:MAG: methyltransferase [Clostridia bacterium]|nr:methyltransferase [Clostridia bacterium]
MTAMSKDKVRSLLSQPNGTEKLSAKPEIVLPAAWELFTEEANAAACGFLCACAKQKKLRENIAMRLQQDRAPLWEALQSPVSKMRKNAARLCGALANPADAPALLQALQKEDTRFVLPSILLSLGAIGGAEAEAALLAYTVEEGDPKHVAAEKEALRMARARCATTQKHAYKGFAKPVLVELRTPKWLSESLVYELKNMGLSPVKTTTAAVTVRTANLPALYQARSFTELLLPLGKCENKLQDIADVAAPMGEMLRACHDGEPPFSYRVEAKGEVPDRARFAKDMAMLMDGPLLRNAPSDYEAELRVEIGKSARVYVKLFSIPDTRFPYRKETLPASIHPAVAAAVLRYARAYLKEGDRVLDPCCGSGTLLFEREMLNKCESLTGVDIAHKAVEIARGNAAAGESRAKFVVNDCRRFIAGRQYDEVIANLPFGNRVGNHSENETLYAEILDKLTDWMQPDGTAVLYTMEFTLLKKLLRARPALELVTETKTDAGGLMPGIFIIRFSKRI